MNLYQVAEEITARLTNTFLLNDKGERPVNDGSRKFHDDPHWRELVLFYEYFHGDNGAGLGAKLSDRLDRSHRPRHAFVRDNHSGASPRTRPESW
jgi:hypothetical protein